MLAPLVKCWARTRWPGLRAPASLSLSRGRGAPPVKSRVACRVCGGQVFGPQLRGRLQWGEAALGRVTYLPSRGGQGEEEPWRRVFGLGDSAALASFLRLPHGLWLLQCARPHFLCPGLWGGPFKSSREKTRGCGPLASVPRHGAPRSPGTLPSGGLHLSLHHQLCCTPSGPWRWPFLLGAPPLPSQTGLKELA